MTLRATFQAVKQHDESGVVRFLAEPVEIDEILIRGLPAFATKSDAAIFRQRARIDGLQVPARQPPRSTINRSDSRPDGSFTPVGLFILNVLNDLNAHFPVIFSRSGGTNPWRSVFSETVRGSRNCKR